MLDLIINDLKNLKLDVKDIKRDVSTIKNDIFVVKTIQEVKTDTQTNKSQPSSGWFF
jgi:hypothetical protein